MLLLIGLALVLHPGCFWYNTVSGGDDDQSENTSGHRLLHFQLQNRMGTIAQRCHQVCLRVPVMTPESHGDNYYYHLLLLYLPWRQETEDLLGDSGGTLGQEGS